MCQLLILDSTSSTVYCHIPSWPTDKYECIKKPARKFRQLVLFPQMTERKPAPMKELPIKSNSKLYTECLKPIYLHYMHNLGKCYIIYNQLHLLFPIPLWPFQFGIYNQLPAQNDEEGLQKLFKLLYTTFNVHLTCPQH